MLDPRIRRRHRVRNAAQVLLLVGGMLAVLALLAWAFFGPLGLLVALGVAVAGFVLRPAATPRLVLSMYRAQRIPPTVLPELHHFVRVLAARARLPAVPALYYVASPMLNAFAVGGRDDAAIAVTDGLLRNLPSRELAGVLAHEVSHIRAGDLWIMNLSDVIGRVTHALAYGGVLSLLITVPLMVGGGYPPLWLLALLGALPTVVSLLQLALSRSREYDADLEAAVLTGDPEGLARGLERLESATGRIWERVVVPHRRAPDPLLLRTHPPTEERTRRLRELVPRTDRDRLGDHRPIRPTAYPQVQAPVRLHFPGVRW